MSDHAPGESDAAGRRPSVVAAIGGPVTGISLELPYPRGVAVTGLQTDPDALWQAGERIWNLRRAVMVLRENRLRGDDTLDDRWFEWVQHSGEELVEPLDRTQWEATKDRYYELRGWDVNTGRPMRARLEELGMGDVADTLEAAGRIG